MKVAIENKGVVKGIISNLVIAEASSSVLQNEVCFVHLDSTRLMGEVIKISGNEVFIQVFESTRGLKTGAEVSFTGNMIEATLGPGILSKKYDGLQNDLDKMESLFLKRGEYTNPLEEERLWPFSPLVKKGDLVKAGDWLGEVTEHHINHKIMVPFKLKGDHKVKSIVEAGNYTVNHTIAVLQDIYENEIVVTMVQKWPVTKSIKSYIEKPRPFSLLKTGVRIIDTMNPIAEGGTGFIPGPFGSGKTVLQHALAKQADVDVVIIAACGERANEIVEIFSEFPKLDDPHTGGKLMERTVIIANTSNMPVAARETSVYTAMTLAEYYRSMGLKVLILADSTSRWAQALREMSNRMEELPGPDAFPMDLPAIISNFYARSGVVKLNNGQTGSVTFIGTVSPAGGNLKEPVTEATKKAARCFYALSQQRADSKRYPAIDPVDSYSKYLEYPELQKFLDKSFSKNWLQMVTEAKDILLRGKETKDQINILGDDSVPLEYHIKYWKAELIDFIILQQDAFDDIDCLTPLPRQHYMLKKIMEIANTSFRMESFEEVPPFFKRLINICKQMNYASFQSDQFQKYEKELNEIIDNKAGKNEIRSL